MVKTIDYSQTQLIYSVFQNAIESRASDIHLDPTRDAFSVRFRIDGVLYATDTFKKELQEELVSQIKVLSQLDITETRSPQDGHFEFAVGGRGYNMRVSTFPTVYGEAIVLRILNREDVLMPLENLGFTESQLQSLPDLIHHPHGIILITGPSASGKTTLLYSILQVLKKPENNIITVEDPVELQMENIRQVQIHEGTGLTFAQAMRGILRQDPDIVMVGEIRDAETLQMATQAALSGRLVFSTFHTFNTPALIIRLLEMGIPTSVVAHALVGIVAVRLVRKICPSCAAPYAPSALEERMAGGPRQSRNFRRGKGCEHCRNSGYVGRTGVFEVLPFDEQVKSHILEGKSPSLLPQLFREKGIESLEEVALKKTLEGITTIEEVVRVLGVLPSAAASSKKSET